MMTMKKMNKIISFLDKLVIISFILMICLMIADIIFPIPCLWTLVWCCCIMALSSNAISYILDEVKIFLVKEDKIAYNKYK